VRRQPVLGQPSIEPGIGPPQPGLAGIDLRRERFVPHSARRGIVLVDEVGRHHPLHVAHHVVVEHPVDHPRHDRLGRIGGDERGGTGVVDREVLDDRARLDHDRSPSVSTGNWPDGCALPVKLSHFGTDGSISRNSNGVPLA
jgi:hypothetical protein